MSEGQEGDLTVAQWLEMMDAGAKECAKLLAEYKNVPPPPPVLSGFDSQGRLLTAQSAQQWEYLQEEIPQVQWQMRLEMLGAEGWELVHQVESYPRYWLCFFKRPKG